MCTSLRSFFTIVHTPSHSLNNKQMIKYRSAFPLRIFFTLPFFFSLSSFSRDTFPFAGVCGLRLHRIVVPTYKLRGENAVLECHYDLDEDSLYAVKWYKENEEFYRYVPKSHPPQYSYKVEGIKVIVRIKFQIRYLKLTTTTRGLHHLPSICLNENN